MSILQYTDSISCQNLQIWNNATFDDAAPSACIPSQAVSNKRLDSLDHDPIKENRSPAFPKKTSGCIKAFPLTPYPSKQSKVQFQLDLKADEDRDDEKSIDVEIEVVEQEIERLVARLEALKLKKAEKDSKSAAAARSRGRTVAARFMEPRQNEKVESSVSKKVEQSPSTVGFRRRNLSLGPSEIVSGLYDVTPIQSARNRRRSCFLKHPGIIEEEEEEEQEREEKKFDAKASKLMTVITGSKAKKNLESSAPPRSTAFRKRGVSFGPAEIASATKSRGSKLQEINEENLVVKKTARRSLSISPKSCKAASKMAELRKGIVTVDSKKVAKKETSLLDSLLPKVLFREEEKPVPGKRPLKGRNVASRYSLASCRSDAQTPEGKRRKWSLTEKEKEEELDAVKRPNISLSNSIQKLASDCNEKIQCKVHNVKPSAAAEKIVGLLPKIRTSRCLADSPRDSGPAKRIIELINRRTHFDALMESNCSQSLNFEDETLR